MGEAFNERGERIAEAYGQTKREVFDKLSELAPNAAKMQIRTLVQDPRDAMCEQPMPTSGREDGPCRETCRTILERRLQILSRELLGYEQLLKIVSKIEDGSPAETVLWESLNRTRHFNF